MNPKQLPKYLQKEHKKLDRDLQIHTLHVLDICFQLEKLSKKKLNKESLYPMVILHDVKNKNDEHEKLGAKYAEELLRKNKKSYKIIETVSKGIALHGEKPKVKDFTTACFFDADILCRFYPIGVLRDWDNIKTDKRRNWKKLFNKISDPKTIDQYPKMMKKKLQVPASKKLLDSKLPDYYNTYELLRGILK